MNGKKQPRKRTPVDVETSVLAKSARRCVLCFSQKGDLMEKFGQIAHLDEDRANSAADNLAWMCLEHHSLYDSKTSQHKNYTVGEVKEARSRLYELVRDGKHLTPVAAQPYLQVEADKRVLRDFLEVVPSSGSIKFLRVNDFGGTFNQNKLRDIYSFVQYRDGPEHEFLDSTLEQQRQKFRAACQSFVNAIAEHTFQIQARIETPYCEVPKDWREEKPDLFRSAVEAIHTTAETVCSTYDDLVRLARKMLAF
jgi:hypothetical protein